MSADRGPWMRTRSRGRFYPMDPRPEEMNILDLASGVARECRYGGQIEGWLDVAQHSIHVASILPDHLKLQGLMHDTPEGLIHDMTRPNKMTLPDYRALEDRVWRAVSTRFGLPYGLDPMVKQADDAVLMAERNFLFPEDKDIWSVRAEPADIRIQDWDYRESERRFLEMFHDLTKGEYL